MSTPSPTSSGTRLKKVRKLLGLSQQQLARELNISQGTLSQIENDYYHPSFHTLSTLHRKWEVNSNWLVTGRGNVFQRDRPAERQPNSPAALVAGEHAEDYPQRCDDPAFLESLPVYQLPFTDGEHLYRIFQLNNDSMHPTFQSEDMVICRYSNANAANDGELVMIVTHELAAKRFYRYAEDKQHVLLKCDNPAYKPILVHTDVLRELWSIHSRITTTFDHNTHAQRARIDQLEADLETLRQEVHQLRAER